MDARGGVHGYPSVTVEKAGSTGGQVSFRTRSANAAQTGVGTPHQCGTQAACRRATVWRASDELRERITGQRTRALRRSERRHRRPVPTWLVIGGDPPERARGPSQMLRAVASAIHAAGAAALAAWGGGFSCWGQRARTRTDNHHHPWANRVLPTATPVTRGSRAIRLWSGPRTSRRARYRR